MDLKNRKIFYRNISIIVVNFYFFIFFINYFLLYFEKYDVEFLRNSFIAVSSIIMLVNILIKVRHYLIRLVKQSLFIYLFIFIVTLLHLYYFSRLRGIFINNIVRHSIVCIPMFILGRNIRDIKTLKREVNKYFNVIILLSLVFIVLTKLDLVNFLNYSMGIAYSTLFFLSLFTVLNKKNIFYYIKILFILLFIVIYGSRGALLGYVILVGLYIVNTLLYKRKYVSIFILSVLNGILILNKEKIIEIILFVFDYFNINSRTIYLLQKKGIYLSGRDKIYSILLEQIKERPYLIRGIFSEQIFLKDGAYAHNVILELLYQLGIILGGILIIVLLYLCLKTVLLDARVPQNAIIFAIGIISISRLMVSSEIWINIEVWFWLGLIIEKLREEKEKDEKNYYNSNGIKFIV